MVKEPWRLLFLLLALVARSAWADCKAPLEITSAPITLVGELHGTKEAPGWVGDLACGVSTSHPLVLGLEIPKSEQGRIDRFMASRGGLASRRVLLEGPFWSNEDGRASMAMVELIERARKLKTHGRSVRVIALDEPNAPSRNAAMARTVRALHRQAPRTRILVLVGNMHAANSLRIGRAMHDQPVGVQLRDLAPFTVNAVQQTGTAWVCMGVCGPYQVDSAWGSSRKRGFYVGSSPIEGYAAYQVLGPVTASPPAVRRGP